MRVSVVIPHHNQSQYINDALESVFNQTYKPSEIIVIDDGSTKEHIEKVKSLLSKFYFKLIIRSNHGQTITKNFGVKMSEGDIICCLDSDDVIEPSYLKKCVDVLKNNTKIGFVYSWKKIFGEVEKIIKYPEFASKDFLIYNPAASASVFKKSAWSSVNGFKERKIEGYEDWDFWISIIEKGYGGFCIQKPLFRYRKHGESRNSKSKKNKLILHEIIRFRHPRMYKEKVLPPLRLLAKKRVIGLYLFEVFIKNFSFVALFYIISAVKKKLI